MKTATPSHPGVTSTLRAVTRRIAPVWPLDRFVAVNPYLGIQDRDFVDAVALLERVAGARSTMAVTDYRSRLQRGRFDRADLDRAIAEAGSSLTSDRILAMLDRAEETTPAAEVMTVADALQDGSGFDWSRFTVEHLGAFFASYFDTDRAAWQPDRGASLFATWKAEAEIDRTPEIMGAKGFRAAIASLPASFEDAAHHALTRLDVPQSGRELYLHRLLMRLGGWSAYAARIAWERKRRDGGNDDTLVELLAILLAFEHGLYESLGDPRAASRWRHACERTARLGERSPRGGATEARVLLQRALELGFRRKLIADFEDRPAPEPTPAPAIPSRDHAPRPRAQAVFCIDVRSEVFRRHLEAADAEVETLGFAGFFGFPVELVPVGHDRGSAQCPVLLEPGYRVPEKLDGTRRTEAAVERRVHRHAVARAWHGFKTGAISCFSFVSPVGLSYLPKLLTDSFGITRPVPHPSVESLGRFARERTVDLEPGLIGGQPMGIPLPDRIDLAAGALRGMSLTDGFARLVVFTGHGATTVNNPHASGLDCGACGGRTGEANARVAAEVLNDPRVREGLRDRGIDIPDDTVFVAALHDTTTDEITVFSRERVPASHRDDLERLERRFAAASATCRLDRARRLHGSRGDTNPDVLRRSRDWAEVRPEWGLAGCAAFVVAPRGRTAAIDLEGRAFLHSYSWDRDPGFTVLESIMTAPMIVASWINLQYYGSAVDPHVFGAGNKTLHNVVGGTVGVLEGNTGDLRVGLPWQSIHDGERLQHEPIRLHAMIEAPIEAMNAIIERHESVRQLLDNGWIHLFALDENGKFVRRYAGNLTWTPVEDTPVPEESEAWTLAS